MGIRKQVPPIASQLDMWFVPGPAPKKFQSRNTALSSR